MLMENAIEKNNQYNLDEFDRFNALLTLHKYHHS